MVQPVPPPLVARSCEPGGQGDRTEHDEGQECFAGSVSDLTHEAESSPTLRMLPSPAAKRTVPSRR